MEDIIKKSRIYHLTIVSLFTALMVICSWISIPIAIPFTLQTFAVFAAVGFLGLKRGLISVALYILLGALGLPVFAGFLGGPGVLLGNAGGYIIGFWFAAAVTGLLLKWLGDKTLWMILAMVLGLLVCYAFGTAWYMLIYTRTKGPVGLEMVLSWCVLPFLLPDFVKIGLAVLLVKRITRHHKI